jgi:3-deoxy-D-manno-octulosonic-acid transferase
MPRRVYTLLIFALLPWACLHLLWRARRQPAYLRHWGERFGFYGGPPCQPDRAVSSAPTFWLHAVSVGETRAAQPLVASLRARYPACRILLTHMTPTGRATSEAVFGDTVERVYLPYDTPGAMHRFLRHFRPDLGLVMETELWPNLVAACGQAGVPLLLVNARLSEKSARRYARWPTLTQGALRGLRAIAAIGEDDARRLRDLGATEVAVLGSMKFDIEPPGAQLALGKHLRARCGDRPVFLCASTREGEEALILDAWQQQKVGADKGSALQGGRAKDALLAVADDDTPNQENPLLVLVPRHPQRFDDVARLVETRGLRLQRRSDEQPVDTDTQVWLGDSMGEMFAYYAAADLVFVGGSLLAFGCQNLIEPCAVGAPVLIGPSIFNFSDAAQAALAAGAARQVVDAHELVEQARALLADPSARATMSVAGRNFSAAHRGATARTQALIESILSV